MYAHMYKDHVVIYIIRGIFEGWRDDSGMKELAALPEAMGSIPNTHNGSSQPATTQSQGLDFLS